MTRIIGGTARGRQIAVPPAGTRPTSDRAREALFNALDARVGLAGARVLDLFAGSGAVGLEALSRGAEEAVLVESAPRAVAVLRANIATLGLPGAHVVSAPVERYLAAPPPMKPFDAVFADPPYALSDHELGELLRALDAEGWLSQDAWLVIERSARGVEPPWPASVTFEQQRRYGEAALWYGRRP